MKSTFNIFCIILMASAIGRAQNNAAKADTSTVNRYNHLADQFKNSNPDSTFFYARKAEVLALKVSYSLGLANAYINQGNAEIITGNYAAAQTHFKKARLQYKSLLEDDSANRTLKSGLARAYASSAVVYTQESNYFMALENYHKALRWYEETGEQTSISKALNNIGIVYKSQLDYPKALEYLKKANRIQNDIGEPNVAMTLTNIGVIYFETGNLNEALQYYKKAENAFTKNTNPIGLALLKNYLGDFYKSSNIALSMRNYRQSLDLSESMQNKFGASLALYNIGKLYTQQKNYANALPFATKSLAYAKEIGASDQTYHSEKLVSELYGLTGNTAESFSHYKNYIAVRDSVFNKENTKKFVQSEMNSEYRKKEALLAEKNKRQAQLILFVALGILLLIILTLVVHNRMQVKRRLTLQKEVAEYEQKALHLQMNPHFVFNCLGAISSFIVQNGTDSALKYLSKFSKLMRLTLEYSKDSLIPIDKEIESLQNYLELEQLRFHNKFVFKIESSAKVEFNMGLPPLLIQPFVENAILHGIVPKEGNGKIDVIFDVVNGQLICTITDDGIGVSESMLLKENSVTAHKSMAMEITKKRLEILESTTSKTAQIAIEELNNSQTGTRVTLRLPVQYIS